MKRAVLFDFDLTLADSTRGAIECINYALVKMGLPQAEDQAIKATIGLSLPATLVAVDRPDGSRAGEEFHSSFCGMRGSEDGRSDYDFPGCPARRA